MRSTLADLQLVLALLLPLPLARRRAAPSACLPVVRFVQLCQGFWVPTVVLCRVEGAARRRFEAWRAAAGAGGGSGHTDGHESEPDRRRGGASSAAQQACLRQLCWEHLGRWQGLPSALALVLLMAATGQAVMLLSE